MYQYSLAWFVALFLRTVQATPEVLDQIVTYSNSNVLTSREGMGWKVEQHTNVQTTQSVQQTSVALLAVYTRCTKYGLTTCAPGTAQFGLIHPNAA